MRSGSRRALAQAVTMVESALPEHRPAAEALLDELLPATGGALRLGITGPPGVGKSTFIERLGLALVQAGRRVAVLAVDPSSSVSGGSILGDKTRMALLGREENAFIRPSAAGGALGGVARRSREAVLLCEAAGFDPVIVETVGVGQSEVAVAEMTDMLLLLLQPGSGDELQGIKRGIVERADLLLVNKADGDLAAAAGRTAADFAHALRLLQPAASGWAAPVLTCSALTGTGIEEAWRAVVQFRDRMRQSGATAQRRAAQSVQWLRSELSDGLLAALQADAGVAEALGRIEAKVAGGSLLPSAAARSLLRGFLARR